MAAVSKGLLEDLFTVTGQSGDEVHLICPEPDCGDVKGKRSVNMVSGKTGCWRCNKGGDFYRWARGLGYDVTAEASEASGSISMARLELARLESDKKKRGHAYVSELKLPRGFTRIEDEPECAYARLITRMAERKNLTKRWMIEAGVGFTRDVESGWEPYAIFPVFEYGRLVYFQGRTYTDEPGKPTKKFPSRKLVPDGSRNWIYNIDEAREKGGVIVIVESILNVLSLKREFRARKLDSFVPVAVFKHKISEEQLDKLLGLRKMDEVCVCYDPDATAHAWTECAKIANHAKASVAVLTGTEDANDNAFAAVEAVLGRKAYSPVASLLSRL